ncbi:hypothetical protein [Gimesia chilikensis]|uniref:hypothetical protein n=1 Tax=Gimesia chilikensis TaxID=2605989 RepID=UPI003A8EE51D
MLSSLLERITGKDDLERVACKEDPQKLNVYLQTRRLLFPKRPRRMLDANVFTQEELLALLEEDARDLASDELELWILDVDGQKRLPAFSSEKKLQTFAARVSQDLNKVFGAGYVEVLMSDVVQGADVDFIDLNLFSERSWEIGVR